ncbi:translation initiation factor IF-2 [Kiloniella laminariae]|uniref:Translation initiation factor IF-2 n=1 Tax=Kiloniella laminariae TaxID=454162 RepID=A0ABT4LJN3_9PROT|nr:translation initiation factor IF-2 [Kiloniella laminariae]MCZ4281315.1 translation initiation factor IF-2 [Kiloniella laminariae]
MTSSKDTKSSSTPLTLKRPNTLELKKTVETGQVKQSFSHGRSKSVTVEVKRSRTFERGASGRMAEVRTPLGDQAGPAATSKPTSKPAAIAPASSHDDLTNAERAKRMQVLEAAREAEERKRQEAEIERERRAEEEARQAEENARLKLEEEARAKREAAEERVSETKGTLKKVEEEAVIAARAATEARKKREAAENGDVEDTRPNKLKARQRHAQTAVPSSVGEVIANELGGRVKQANKPVFVPKDVTAKAKAGDDRRNKGKLTITRALEGGEGDVRQRSLASIKRRRQKKLQQERGNQNIPVKVVREVTLPETITVQELSNRMAERATEVIKQLMKLGVMATINQTIDADTAEVVIQELGHTIKRVTDADVEMGMLGLEGNDEVNLIPRPPVVTIMGHVDHGKTSLLDAIRSTDVVRGEAGGITQHIGAYQVNLASGNKITFLDTPGHAAFTEMRLRGATVTDVVVLVVAADDGIMEQTIEAINHAKASQVPIIVAINKVDKPDSNPDRVKQELLQHELVVEDMGGDILCIEVSAKARTGLDKLEEAILLQAELLELKANPDRSAIGTVIESKLDKGRGSIATVLVQKGTLKVGDIFVTGNESGRVRALMNERGQQVDSAGPSLPVEVLGLNGTPNAGDDFVVVESEAKAREIAAYRGHRDRELAVAAAGRGSLEQMLAKLKEGTAEELPVIVKADVHGSMEAISTSLQKMNTEEVKVTILHSGVGAINESDITLAQSTGAMVVAFNVRANPQARELARRENIDIRYYSIIYNVVDDVKSAMSGLLEPEQREKFTGYAQIREVFNVTKVGKVAGCMITEGTVQRGSKVRLLRDNVVIHDGALKTLRRFKDEVKEVKEGYECGMAFENYSDIQVGDQIECYIIEEIAREL